MLVFLFFLATLLAAAFYQVFFHRQRYWIREFTPSGYQAREQEWAPQYYSIKGALGRFLTAFIKSAWNRFQIKTRLVFFTATVFVLKQLLMLIKFGRGILHA